MKKILFGLLITLSIAGCDSAGGPSGSGSQAVIANDPAPIVYTHFAYQTSYMTNINDRIYVYGVDPDTYELRALNTINSSVPGSKACSMAMHPNKKFIYVVNCNSDMISQYAINDQTGTLTPLNPAIVSMNDVSIKSKEIGFDSNGDLYVSYFKSVSGILTNSNLGRFTVNATTGKATFVSWVVAGNPSGQFESYLVSHPSIQMTKVYISIPTTKTAVLGQMSYVIQPGLDNIEQYDNGALTLFTTFVSQPIMMLLK